MLLAGLALCAVSCQEKNLETEGSETGKTMTFTASFGDTKVALGENGVTPLWQAGDKITIYAINGDKKSVFTTQDSGATATFKGEVGADFNGPYYAVYGHLAKESHVWENAVSNVQIWKDQTVGDQYTAPMVAYSENTVLNFKNAAALLKFTVNADNVQSVRLETDARITGEGACGKNIACAIYDNDQQGFRDVTLRGNFEKGYTYHIVVAPTPINSLRMVVNGDESRKVAKQLTFERSNIYNLGTVEQADVKHVNCDVYLAYKEYVNLWGWSDKDGDWFKDWPGLKTQEVVTIAGLGECNHWNFNLASSFFEGTCSLKFSKSDSNKQTGNLNGITLSPRMYFKIDNNTPVKVDIK